MSRREQTRNMSAVDKHVGSRIRERRILLGLTQQQLADLVGVTYQQAHKYERGINRVSAGRLYEIARVLSVPIEYFYIGLGSPSNQPMVVEGDRMCLETARNFAAIKDMEQRRIASELVRSLARMH